ncbi:MAG: hypothetical protein ABIK99_00305 [candidate division WOR-3 bacterium]
MRNKLLLLLPLLLLSCREKIKPYINALLLKSIEEEGISYYKRVYLYKEDGFAFIPQVKINDTSLPITDFSYHWYLYEEEKAFAPERRYLLVIDHDGGKATSEIIFPGNFEIKKPEENFLLQKDSNLFIIWQRAKNGERYLLSLYLAYSYLDTSGNNLSFVFASDTLISDTFFLYQKEIIFPRNVERINWGEGIINIWAVAGSLVLPGEKENIKGRGRGFYSGLNHSGERYFRVAQVGKRTSAFSPMVKERWQRKLGLR